MDLPLGKMNVTHVYVIHCCNFQFSDIKDSKVLNVWYTRHNRNLTETRRNNCVTQRQSGFACVFSEQGPFFISELPRKIVAGLLMYSKDHLQTDFSKFVYLLLVSK